MSDLNKIINEQRDRIAKLEKENALLLVKTLPECNCEGLQDRIAELEQRLVEVTNGATGQAPCAKYCEAKATEIEMRKLRAENESLKRVNREHGDNLKRVIDFCQGNGIGTLGKSYIDCLCAEVEQLKQRAEAAEKRLAEVERELTQKKLVHVGYTNGYQIYYAKNDESGSFYPDTYNDCYIPLYMLDIHLHRLETTLGEELAGQLHQQLNGGERWDQ